MNRVNRILSPILLTALIIATQTRDLEAGDGGEIVTFTGTLSIIQADDFEHGRSETLHFVHEKDSGKVYRLHFEGTSIHEMRAGSTVRVRGRAKGDEVNVAADGLELIQNAQPATAPAVVSGNQRTAVMLVNLLDVPVPCSAASVSNIMFAISNSVDAVYREASYGNVSFSGDILGPYTIGWASYEGCRYINWALSADQTAEYYGIDLSQYDRRVYVLPFAGGCGWSGLATIGSLPSRAWIASCANTAVYTHELGHNFFMDHANADPNNSDTGICIYCDYSDFMGSADVGLHQLNAPHKEQMGWTPPEKIVAPTTNGVYDIGALELNPQNTSYPQSLKSPRLPTGDSYYFSYRRPIGYDSGLSGTYVDRLSIHHYGGGSSPTYFITSLGDGQTFTDTVSGISLQQLSHTNDRVRVQVMLSCDRVAPQISVSPASQSGRPGTNLNYTVSLKNLDCGSLTPSLFSLTPSVPSGWTATLSSNSFYLYPGAKVSTVLSVYSPVAAGGGSNSVGVVISDSAVSVHNVIANGSYIVDATPPPTPTSFSAQERFGQVNLTWTASTDNVGVTLYSVWRNCVKIADTQYPYYTDPNPGPGTWIYYVTATDAAGNISPPSNSDTVTTQNNVAPTVSVIASRPTAQEYGAAAGAFTIVRSGSIKSALSVGFTVSGSALNGVDYSTIASPVSIPANSACAEILISPIPDNLAEGDEIVTLSLTANASYTVGSASNATVTIKDKPFDAWRASKFTSVELTNQNISGDAADPDGDGILNLMEYARGLEPKIADSGGAPTPTTEVDHLTIVYSRIKAATDVSYIVEVAGDVDGPWLSGPTSVSEQLIAQDAVIQTIRATDMTPISAAQKRFIRLRVTRQ